jgi:hypothetical protein
VRRSHVTIDTFHKLRNVLQVWKVQIDQRTCFAMQDFSFCLDTLLWQLLSEPMPLLHDKSILLKFAGTAANMLAMTQHPHGEDELERQYKPVQWQRSTTGNDPFEC